MRLVRPAVLALTLLSCTADERVGPSRPLALQADLQAVAELPAVRISELHYDNASTDVGEAIEVSGPAGTDLTGWSIVLYTGSDSTVYDTDALSGTIADQCDGRGTAVLAYPVNGIQNGSPDGVALVDAGGTVVEFLSYEGTFTAVDGPANGMVSSDIGVREDGSVPIGQSLQRASSGSWFGPLTASFGACNVDPVVASVVVSPASATVVEGDGRQFTATAFTAANEAIAGVAFAWSSTAPSVAEVNATGFATGLVPGDAGIVATAPNGIADTAELRVDETPAPPPAGPVNIVEIHYDNSGADAGEAVEVEGPAGLNLAGWSVVLYNGSGGARYGTLPLTGTLANQCSGRGVVSVAAVGLQNGSPDGLALVNAGGVVVEFLSYEGTFTAADGPAAGMIATDIGVEEDNSVPPAGQSLQKDADGWYGPVTASFGACNVRPGPTLTIVGRSSTDPDLPVGFQDQLFATVRDASGVELPLAITWSSDTPDLASIDERGVFTALAPGTAVLRATGEDGTTATIALATHIATASATAVYAGNAAFGVPADADPSDDVIVEYDQYTASYNRNRGTPNWVSYNLEATHFGPEDRCDCFTFDPELQASFTPYTTADYTGAGAFHGYLIDRGHLARSFDRTSGSLDNATTFYFTNIIPQAADLNQGPWAALEMHVGDLARFQNREVYIIAGVAGSKGTVKNEHKIEIPESVWKVALILPRDDGLADVGSYADVEVIAVIMPNDPGIQNVNWETYRTTVDAVEALSGYDLLALLPDHIEIAVESNTRPPSALTDGPYTSLPNLSVAMSAAGSSDPDGDALTYAWSFGDGAAATGVAVTHTYAQAGTHTVRLIVTDIRGLADTSTTTATVVTAVQGVRNAIALVDALAADGKLDASDARWLHLKLNLAIKHLEGDRLSAAVDQLEDVLARLDGAADAEPLRAAVRNVIQSVSP